MLLRSITVTEFQLPRCVLASGYKVGPHKKKESVKFLLLGLGRTLIRTAFDSHECTQCMTMWRSLEQILTALSQDEPSTMVLDWWSPSPPLGIAGSRDL